MKQTIEEAVRKYADDKCQERGVSKKYRLHFDFDRYDVEQGFKAGAEWQSKQSPWISVNDRLPEENIEVIIYHEYEFYIGKMYHSMLSNWWRINKNEADDIIADEDDLWMPIPSFDEILEANRDVLERIKEKGD
ncbi:DUF551 domain-containing protein [Bacteroides salyersiae]|nr:DUF551 domain-containing protein [Bacteroides salyersiae]